MNLFILKSWFLNFLFTILSIKTNVRKMFLKRRSFFEKYDKILYLPIEIHSREFHAKLYLSYQASQRGWIVIIGPEYDVNKLARYMPPGVYFGNGFHNKDFFKI